MAPILFWLCIGSVLYTYIGYPLVLALVARIRPKARPYEPIAPSVTLLIAAYNEEAIIAEKIENSLALEYPREKLQILVASAGSDDQTVDVVREYSDQGVELNHGSVRQGKMAAINRAMPQATGEIIVFSDANNMYASDVLHELVRPFADPMVGAVSGAKVILGGDGTLGASEGLYWKYEAFIKEQETRLGCCVGATGENSAIRRALFEPPPDNVINDDFYMATRVMKRGYCVVYAPNARSYERVSQSAQDEVVRRSRIVAGRYQAMALAGSLLPLNRPLIIWQIVSHKFMRLLMPLAMMGALLTNIVAVVCPARSSESSMLHLSSPFNWLILLSQLLFYGLAWIGNRQTERKGTGGMLLYLPTFLVNSNLAAVVGLYRFLTKSQTPLWQRVQRRPQRGHPVGTDPEESETDQDG